jgi:hypothetical protein
VFIIRKPVQAALRYFIMHLYKQSSRWSCLYKLPDDENLVVRNMSKKYNRIKSLMKKCTSCWFSLQMQYITMHGSENVKSAFQLKVRKKHIVQPTVILALDVSGSARFQFFMAVFMKDGVLTNVTPCTLITSDWHLAGRLCLQYLNRRTPEDGSINTLQTSDYMTLHPRGQSSF